MSMDIVPFILSPFSMSAFPFLRVTTRPEQIQKGLSILKAIKFALSLCPGLLTIRSCSDVLKILKLSIVVRSTPANKENGNRSSRQNNFFILPDYIISVRQPLSHKCFIYLYILERPLAISVNSFLRDLGFRTSTLFPNPSNHQRNCSVLAKEAFSKNLPLSN